MKNQKTASQLREEKAVQEQKIQQLRHKQQQLENRISYYEAGDRRKRAHRLITRGAAVESVAPDTRDLTETEFYTLTEKLFSLPGAGALLAEALHFHNQQQQEMGC